MLMKPKFLIPIIIVLVSIPLSIAGYSIATRTNTRPPELHAQSAKASTEVKGATTDPVQNACIGKRMTETCSFTLARGETISGICGMSGDNTLTCAPTQQ